MSAPVTEAAPVWRGVGEVPAGFGPCVATVGVFDGLHRGHVRLVERAVRLGGSRGLPAVLVTFDPHPARVLGLPRDTAQLSTVERRAELAGDLGLGAICALPFTPEFARLGPAEFVERVLVSGLRAQEVVVGANFTFGHRAAGTVETLRDLGEHRGFSTHSVDLVHAAGGRCSSTAARECLRRGDIRGATRVLGRPHRVEGTIRPAGDAEAELVAAHGTAVPAPGRYRGRVAGAGPVGVGPVGVGPVGVGPAGSEPVALRVTDDGRVLVESPGVLPGGGRVEFTDREAAR